MRGSIFIQRKQKFYCCEGPQALPTIPSRKAMLERRVEKFDVVWLALY